MTNPLSTVLKLNEMPSLREAIQKADLPAMLERLFPDCGARAGQRGRIKCVWRGGTDYSGSLFVDRGGKWKLTDFVTNESFDAFEVLISLAGMTKAQAALELTGERPDATRRKSKPPKLSNLPEFPIELRGWLWAYKMVKEPMWDTNTPNRFQTEMLEILAEWIADSIKDSI